MCVAGGWLMLFVFANEEKCDTLDNTDVEDLVDDLLFRGYQEVIFSPISFYILGIG
jgi:hypothetical protein